MEEFRPLEAVAAPVFVIERDDQGTPRYIYCNPAYYDISAHVADDIIGRTAIEVFGPRLGKMLMARHDRALRGERMSYDVTLPVSQKIINNTLTPLPGGARQRILATSRSAGDRLATARAIEEAALDFERETSLAASAQALRGPMRKHALLVADLLDGFTDLGNGKIELIHEIGHVGERAYALVRQVLTYVRAVADGPSRRERVELPEVAEALFALIDPRGRHALAVRDITLLTYADALEFALTNVLRALLDTGDRMTLEVTGRQLAGDEVALVVRCESGRPQVPLVAAALSDVPRVLKAKRGRLTITSTDDGQEVEIALPGRLLDWQGE